MQKRPILGTENYVLSEPFHQIDMRRSEVRTGRHQMHLLVPHSSRRLNVQKKISMSASLSEYKLTNES